MISRPSRTATNTTTGSRRLRKLGIAVIAAAAAAQGLTAAAPRAVERDQAQARVAAPVAPPPAASADGAAEPMAGSPVYGPPADARASRDGARPAAPQQEERPAEETGPSEAGAGYVPPVITSTGIPQTVLRAYRNAKRSVTSYDPACGLQTSLLAAIGKVESSHAFNGYVDKRGVTIVPIRGPRLDGAPGLKKITDSDGGRYDDDKVFDRAVGPMQFIPTTWVTYSYDGDGDGIGDPDNVYDATVSAGMYLCSGEGDLTVAKDRKAAILRYNGSTEYYKTVMAWYHAYKGNTAPVADSKDAAAAREAAAAKAKGEREADRDRAERKAETADQKAADRAAAGATPEQRPAAPAPSAAPPAGDTAPSAPAAPLLPRKPAEQQDGRNPAPAAPAPKQPAPEQPAPKQAAPKQPAPEQPAPGSTGDGAPHGGPGVEDVLPGLGEPRG